MYEQFYNFSAEPFRLSPDHGFAYAHKGYSKARAYMAYAFLRAEGFVMITGRPGTGKTTLIGALLDELANKSVNIANLVSTQLQAHDLLKLVAYEFGIPASVVEKGELLQRLSQLLKSWHRDGRRALLIVDEAQDLSVSAMEELRLLTNIQVGSQPLLQIFLLGQPELRELILSQPLEQVHQRIIAASHLLPLESDETEAYIRHRLEAVQWRGNPAISKPVYPLVYKFSEGVPRRINLICSRLLLHCAVEQRHRVTVADVHVVVRELQDENLASGNSFAESDFQVADVFDEDIHGDNDVRDRTMAASQGDVGMIAQAKPPSGRAQAMKTTAGTRQALMSENTRGKGAGRIQQADNSGYQAEEDIPRGKTIVDAGQVAPARRPASPAELAPSGTRVPAARIQGIQPIPSGNRPSRPAINRAVAKTTSSGKGEPKAYARQRTGERTLFSGIANADQAGAVKVDHDAVRGEKYTRSSWPIIVIALGIFLLINWTVLGLDVGNLVEGIPSIFR